MRGCIEEGILQSYLDGELSPKMMKNVAAHIAACATCAGAAREAESEFAIFTAAFAPESSLSISTAHLRERIDAAIAGSQPSPKTAATSLSTRLRELFARLAASFTVTPQRAAFASLVVMISLIAAFALVHRWDSEPQIAQNGKGDGSIVSTTSRQNGNSEADSARPSSIENLSPLPSEPSNRTARVIPVRFDRSVKNDYSRARVRPLTHERTEQPEDVLLPGERSYLTTIASLTSAIEARGQENLTPALRAEYERNLALVDHAIGATRVAARHNPKDPDATEFLLAAYQSKVDLLTAVADQAYLSTSGR